MPEPHHHLRVQGTRGALHLDVTLDLTAPWTVIFGPSGSGKSTLLRAACGLVPGLDIHFRRLDSNATTEWHDIQSPTRSLPSASRQLAYAPQGGAVFPHLTVRKNIEFGQRSRGTPATSHFVDEAIDLFSLGPLLERMPRELSGGERQGVSLARAFAVPNARLLLLDEPFNGIGRTMRDALLPRMRARLTTLGIPILSVTHDVEEAYLLNAEVLRIDDGKILAQGPASEVLYEERAIILKNLRP